MLTNLEIPDHILKHAKRRAVEEGRSLKDIVTQTLSDELAATGAWQAGQLRGDFGADRPAYQWTASVQPWNGGVMNELNVEVAWTARQRQRSVVVTTLVNPSAPGSSGSSGGNS